MQLSHDKIKQNMNYILIQKLVTPLINVVITIYVVKKLTIIEYGIYNLLYALMGYLTLFSSMGLLNIFQRFIPEYYVQKEYAKIKSLFNSGLLIRLLFAIIFLMILLLFGKPLNHLFKVENFDEFIKLFFIGIILYLEFQVVEVTLNSLLLNRAIMISYLITTLIRAGLTYIFLEQSLRLQGLLLAETIYYGLLLVTQIFFYIVNFSLKHSSSNTKLPIKRLVRYGSLSYFDELGWTILDVKTDFFVISTFLGPTMVGLYAFANQITESIARIMPDKIVRPLIRTTFFSKFSTNNAAIQLNRDFNFLIKITAFISFPLFLGAVAFGDKIIIYFFDVKYLPGLNLLWIFSGFMLAVGFQFPLQLIVQAIEKVEINFYSKVFSIYNLIGDILVVNIFGIIGVALITCSARLFQFFFIFYRIQKYVSLKCESEPLIKILINSLLMMGGIYLIKGWVRNPATLILFIILSLLFYLVVSFINKSFLVQEREFINKLLPCPMFNF